ncbi:MAG: hypothetical protein ACXVRN_14535 [Solirubrobacteraceae bacterium]
MSVNARRAAGAAAASLATLAALALSASSPAAGFRFTHMVSLTVTVSDHWTRARDIGCTGSVETSGCRTYRIGGSTNVFGIDRRSLVVLSSVRVGDQIRPPKSCVTGDYAGLNDPDFFRRKLSIRMPSPALLRGRRKLALTGSETAQVHRPAFTLDGNIDETVTQTAVLTLTRIVR